MQTLFHKGNDANANVNVSQPANLLSNIRVPLGGSWRVVDLHAKRFALLAEKSLILLRQIQQYLTVRIYCCSHCGPILAVRMRGFGVLRQPTQQRHPAVMERRSVHAAVHVTMV